MNQTTTDFIRDMVREDLRLGKNNGKVQTRWPPEPNGYIHVGHAKGFLLAYGIAQEFGGVFNLRFDDTNPTKEEQEYVDGIIEDMRWLGVDWRDVYFASDYFEQLYEWAEVLIRAGKAYVCDLSAEEVSEYRGTAVETDGQVITPRGKDSPYRNRSPEENLDLFRRMRAGEFPDGSRTLRAKIDMAHPNLNMRDPVMYRILRATHHRQGDAWCIYPTYDWAHGQSDAIEGVTHSTCDLGFENHRPLYDWFLDQLPVRTRPRQIEYGRLNLTHTVMSKRWLRQLVEGGYVEGWDDPRLPTLRGMRRRGYTPAGIREFVHATGVTKSQGMVDTALLEHFQRQELNRTSPRVMAVLDPIRLVITNYPEGEMEWLDAVNNPEDPAAGTRKTPFSRELYIEREDFLEDPPSKFFRLSPGREVRLRYAYFVRCTDVVRDARGELAEIRCTYDPATRGGDAPDGRKVKATLHWVSAAHAVDLEARLYDHLFVTEDPTQVEGERTWLDNLSPNSLVICHGRGEPCLRDAKPFERFQFERKGYFCVDPDSAAGRVVFNRTAGLRDAWAKTQGA
ncbi:MAG: glutamine--tRNA ligase/YqeY domain fusion protein [Candidatus Bipolaricaulis sp.]|nr:glutamine--tRNA ligase/YqeY domain fusion protein [Candidatus Bipolaricaulis sp.]MDD5646429.1 glutamine--tRNA ligase/YqeY domain fusion protein [Candidatus Bipolaricaulis sp.]